MSLGSLNSLMQNVLSEVNKNNEKLHQKALACVSAVAALELAISMVD